MKMMRMRMSLRFHTFTMIMILTLRMATMKLLREALNLYTYIINECESLIKYHSMINGHHVELEREYDIIEEEKEEILFLGQLNASASSSPRRHRRRRSRR